MKLGNQRQTIVEAQEDHEGHEKGTIYQKAGQFQNRLGKKQNEDDGYKIPDIEDNPRPLISMHGNPTLMHRDSIERKPFDLLSGLNEDESQENTDNRESDGFKMMNMDDDDMKRRRATDILNMIPEPSSQQEMGSSMMDKTIKNTTGGLLEVEING